MHAAISDKHNVSGAEIQVLKCSITETVLTGGWKRRQDAGDGKQECELDVSPIHSVLLIVLDITAFS